MSAISVRASPSELRLLAGARDRPNGGRGLARGLAPAFPLFARFLRRRGGPAFAWRGRGPGAGPAGAGGALKLACAHGEAESRYELPDVATTAVRDGEGYRLNGRKSVVFYASAADKLIVSARTAGERRDEEGISLFLIDKETPGLVMTHYRTQDGGRASGIADTA
ncbi:MAG: acyl-CoA dehydrogenase family protein [Proteobacteria bacterium]|nr:acyl-CoA dehydrogenase family protein [Pseudomonadota bacterium]